MILDDLANWMGIFAAQYGYVGIFLISLLGATSVIIPIPSSVIIFTLSSQTALDPLLIAVAAGAGAAIGELSGYLVGLGGRKVIGEKYKKKMDILMKLFKRFGPVVIFVFALTPLPDDLLFIPLGVMRYKILHAFIPALLGKFVSYLIIAYASRLTIGIIRDIFGTEGEGMSLLIGTVLAVVLLIVVFVIMFKVDWEKRAEKYLNATEKPASEGATA
ncbi:MAG TPA: VTT domain-containing protein [Candidatus Bathyarchaeia archaeon]|nr:VTT domain-containing protein [Candidatus Bathyarchaeia archaeon]